MHGQLDNGNASVFNDRHVEYNCANGISAKYYLNDWLDLHGLNARQCETILSQAGDLDFNRDASTLCSRPCNLSGELAWRLAADAMASSFPQAAGLIKNVQATSVKAFSTDCARLERPHTVLIGQDRYPTVFLNYHGRIVDLITVAHEFGHAVQISASGGRFVPPVNRELCAFVSELLLLKLLLAELPDLHPFALAAWQVGNRTYLARHGRALALALTDASSVYQYGWNYPIARVLASECIDQLPTGAQWSIFTNRVPLSGIIGFLTCARRKSTSCTAACLTIAAEEGTGPITPTI